MDILSKIRSGLTYFDGGTGTLLQQQGLRPGELPETWNILHPESQFSRCTVLTTARAAT